MTHNANLGGEPIVEPSEPGGGKHCGRRSTTFAVRRLHSTLRQRQQHSLCKAFFSRFKFDGKHGQERLSHIPVIEKEKFLGVFSVSTIFSCILRDPTLRITKETTLSQLGKMLAVEKHVENYAFGR